MNRGWRGYGWEWLYPTMSSSRAPEGDQPPPGERVPEEEHRDLAPLHEEDGRFWARLFGEKFRIPDEVVGEALLLDDGMVDSRALVAAWRVGEDVFLTVFEPDLGQPFRVGRIDIESGKCVWSREIFGGGGIAGGTGLPTHTVNLLVVGDQVAVFGISVSAAYLEIFNAADGEPVMRFGSGYMMRLWLPKELREEGK